MLRRLLLFSFSFALGIVLIIALTRIGRIDWHVTLQQLGRVSRGAFLLLVILNALLILVSTLKWRTIDSVLRRPGESGASLASAFAFTSVGMALGLMLPVQLGMSIARTLGLYFGGSALKRGTGGTLIEQSFDLLIVGFLAVASAMTWCTSGGSTLWWFCALFMLVIALLCAGPFTLFLRRLTSSARFRNASPNTRTGAFLRACCEAGDSGLLTAELARRLFVLSAVRYFVLVLMCVQTARAINADIPAWQFGAALPLVVLVMVLAVTPGGVGVNELTSTSTLKLFGTPLSVAADWSLANRFLVMASCLVIAACVAVAMTAQRVLMAREIKEQGNVKLEET
jgi:uncharacterized membrane protein YbhN (UPF0104 family)